MGFMHYFSPEFTLDWFIAGVVFFVVSGQHVYTGYVISYDRATTPGHYAGPALLSILWACTILSRGVAVIIQLRGYTNRLLIDGTIFLSVIAALSGFLLYPSVNHFKDPASTAGLYLATIIFGCATGPVLGYCFDLSHRLTVLKEEGAAITILGLNIGTAIMPWLVVFLWTTVGLGPRAFPVIVGVVPCVAIMLMMEVRRRCNNMAMELPKGSGGSYMLTYHGEEEGGSTGEEQDGKGSSD